MLFLIGFKPGNHCEDMYYQVTFASAIHMLTGINGLNMYLKTFSMNIALASKDMFITEKILMSVSL